MASTVQTVDAAMKGWATFVAIGGATAQQEASVKAVYEKYQACQRVAEKAYVAAAVSGDRNSFTVAADAMRAVQVDLLLAEAQGNPTAVKRLLLHAQRPAIELHRALDVRVGVHGGDPAVVAGAVEAVVQERAAQAVIEIAAARARLRCTWARSRPT